MEEVKYQKDNHMEEEKEQDKVEGTRPPGIRQIWAKTLALAPSGLVTKGPKATLCLICKMS